MTLIEVLRKHGLSVFFRERARNLGIPLPERLARELEHDHRDATMRTLLQERALQLVAGALADQRWLVWRGAQLARLAYDDPTVRASSDIDLLVANGPRCIAALEQAGFVKRPAPHVATHAVNLVGHGVMLDVHWSLLRPGRVRFDLSAWALDARVIQDGLPVLDATRTLALLLMHTAITEHVTGRLARSLDIDALVRRHPIDWSVVVDVTRRAGLGAAAWTTLAWTQSILDTPIDPGWLAEIAPHTLHRSYLRGWLRLDPGRVYQRSPLLVRVAFSLALHDSPRDVMRALRVLAGS